MKYELTNCRFGRLLVLRKAEKMPGIVKWVCLCDCGKNTTVAAGSLITGDTKSCGCLHIERSIVRETTHGMHGERFYTIYNGIKNRCLNPNHVGYKYYGGKGIKNLWRTFEDFKRDMYRSYKIHCKNHTVHQTTIDRIDNNGHYCKSNCRWATYKEQANNRG